MEMKNDCPETSSYELSLPKTISGLNIWPPNDPNVTTRDIYEPAKPIGIAEINDELFINPEPISSNREFQILSASNRGQRRGNFAVNPEWTSEDKTFPPKTVRTTGRVYEPNAIDFHGARDLHAKTWEQARIHPGHGANTHHALPGYAPFQHTPLHYRDARQDIADSWPYNQFRNIADSTMLEPDNQLVYKRPRTAAASGAYYTHIPEDNSQYTRELNDLHAVHVQDRINGGKPDIETREFTRSNREITYGYNRPITDKNPYADTISLPQPFGIGGHRELTDLFAQTYSRNLPQMMFRKAQHAHAPWHAYMTFCDWGEPPREPKAVA